MPGYYPVAPLGARPYIYLMRYALLFSLLAALACGDSTAPKSLDGDWQAVSVDGAPLPATYVTGVIETEVVERHLLIVGNSGSYSDNTITRVTQPPYFISERIIAEVVSISRAGNVLSVTGQSVATTFGIRGDELVNSDIDGKTVVYRRQ